MRPRKLRKKALSEDNKDGELARGIGEVGRIYDVERFSLVSRGQLVTPGGQLVAPRKLMG